jgi:hypothetical protein
MILHSKQSSGRVVLVQNPTASRADVESLLDRARLAQVIMNTDIKLLPVLPKAQTLLRLNSLGEVVA